MKREIRKNLQMDCSSGTLDLTEIFEFQKHIPDGEYYLLAWMDDGIVWGYWDGKTLITSNSVDSEISPILRKETFREYRLFNLSAEYHVWKINNTTAGYRLITESIKNGEENLRPVLEETWVLHGNYGTIVKDIFTCLKETRGTIQYIPIPVKEHSFKDGERPVGLTVRHYLAAEKHLIGDNESVEGAWKICDMRLVGWKINGKDYEHVQEA